MLTIPHCKESLSRAYITAVVGKSLNNLWWDSEYDYGVDGFVRKLTRRGTRVTQTGFGFDFQAKSTTNWTKDNGEIVYDLEVDAFNDLAARSAEPRGLPLLLVLMCLNPDDQQWLHTDQDNLILRNCAYWYQIKDDFTTNTATRRIRVPEANTFDSASVITLLDNVVAGTLLP